MREDDPTDPRGAAASPAVPLPPDETERLAALDRYAILDTPPEAAFDDLVRIAAQVCRTPIAVLTLIDRRRQWFKASVGLDIAETDRQRAFCAHTILQREPLVVEDATHDPRFRHNPLVTAGPGIRFYAGVPLVTPDGHALGTLAVIDRVPRTLAPEEQTTLLRLGRQALAQLELRRHALELREAWSQSEDALRRSGERERRAADARYVRQRRALIALTGDPALATGDLGAALRRITEIAAETLGVARVSVWRYVDGDRAIRCVDLYEQQAGRHSAGAELAKATCPHYFEALATTEVIAAADALHDPRTAEFAESYLRPLGIGAMLDAPVQAGGTIDGVLCHEHVGDARAWAEDEQNFAVALANLVSLALTTEAARREASRRRELARSLEMLLGNLPGMVYRCRNEPSWPLEFASAGALALTGYRPEQLVGPGAVSYASLIHRDDRDAVWNDVQRALDRREPFRLTYRIVTAGGAVRWVWEQGNAVHDEAGALLALEGFVTDVTERRQAETALAAHAAELARSNEELERFAYAASHDLQEPLRTVASFTQLLLKRSVRPGDVSAEEFGAHISEAVRRMREQIDGLLAYSRVGRGELRRQPTDLNEVLRKVLAALDGAIRDSGATIHAGPLPTVPAYETLLEPLLQNLIGNALKFRTDAPPEVRIVAERENGNWRISVTDNGIGIEPRHAERIFVLFQRLHTRDRYAGSGIGLAICKRIVERHGGRIWAEPAPPRGTRFVFTLPADAAA